jgi:hypothetical protein
LRDSLAGAAGFEDPALRDSLAGAAGFEDPALRRDPCSRVGLCILLFG